MKTITTFSEQLIQSMREKNAFEDSNELRATGRTINMIREGLHKLRDFVSKNKFSSDEEEMRFFREIKPVLLSQYYYHLKRFDLQLFDSFQNSQRRKENYDALLDKLNQYALTHKHFYQYCVSGLNSNDHNYFLRNRTVNYGIDFDSIFSTKYDNILSKLLANEMLKEYVINNVRSIDTEKHKGVPQLSWTDAKVALIELIYALHISGTINNNKVEIKQIVTAFQQLFDIDLGNYARVFAEIRMRKNGQTTFLDRLRQNLLNRIDDFDR